MPSDLLASLASDPGLNPAWWADETFGLRAAAMGIPERPVATPPLPNDGRAAWEAIAREILARDFQKHPIDASGLESYEIGLRGYPGSPICQTARDRLSVITPVKWRAKDVAAGRLLPRSQAAEAPERAPANDGTLGLLQADPR